MLSEYFSDPSTLERVLACSITPYLETYADAMRAAGYAPTTVLKHLRTAVHLGAWAKQEGLRITSLEEEGIEAFRLHLSACKCPGPRPRRSRDGFITTMALRFLDHLRETDVVALQVLPLATTLAEPELLVGFRRWMYDHRGAKPATIVRFPATCQHRKLTG